MTTTPTASVEAKKIEPPGPNPPQAHTDPQEVKLALEATDKNPEPYPDGEPIAVTQRRRADLLERAGIKDTQEVAEGKPPGSADASGAPSVVTAPMASGTPEVGQILSATLGTWNAMEEGPHNYAFRWFSDDAAIPDATGQSLLISEEDVGHKLSCVVTASNAHGDASSRSNALGPVVKAAKGGKK